MKKRIIAAILMTALLTGCGVPTLEGKKGNAEDRFSNTFDLYTEQVYVWKDKGYGDLDKDLSKTTGGRDIFFKAPLGTISFAGKEGQKDGVPARNIWFEDGADQDVPTVTAKDAILYVSQTTIPETITFERFADNGYSIGVAGMQMDKGGHFYIPYIENRDDAYKYYIDMKSGASVLSGFEGIERLYFDKAGSITVSENSAPNGCVRMQKDKSYDCQFYTGTFYQDFTLKADVRTFTSFEWFESYEYDFLHANCIKLKIPEYLKSGYYLVLGKGLIRYVSPEDEGRYNGGAFDETINWNDPIIQYDESGICIYDPSSGIDMEGSDPGIEDEELMNSGSLEKESEMEDKKDD